ncbi:hypothetical protein E2C01_022767 [Portunus trituberculatus]|uniref:Uncharacterized protein n=1 Tax=Portunus trituberculatus TaxID=210409 RepID=A0A5B7E6W9_PORTR|nr:hypothetical protein [Portunus trituberculatus]
MAGAPVSLRGWEGEGKAVGLGAEWCRKVWQRGGRGQRRVASGQTSCLLVNNAGACPLGLAAACLSMSPRHLLVTDVGQFRVPDRSVGSAGILLTLTR